MNLTPIEIFGEFEAGYLFKSSLGNRGLFEQNKINERFFVGDQWYGARAGADRPLVRHNVIKRIGDYKMSQITKSKIRMNFSAEGIPSSPEISQISEFSGAVTDSEIGGVMSALSDYYDTTCERLNFDAFSSEILRNAYISGTSLLYTYWNPLLPTGTFADDKKTVAIKGDISCELLRIEDVVFGDPYCENLQDQPYIIISSKKNVADVLREAEFFGANSTTLEAINDSATNGKITLLTKLYKTVKADGSTVIEGIKVTENATVRPLFSTNLRLYPIAQFKWENRSGLAYGDSEITYLIPNQIAINRMITANVWAAMSTGLPIMLVNGDTVTEKITNDPGQIIKIYGSNEDVAGAVNFVTPPCSMTEFDRCINNLINNTLTQSGANEVALGDSRADNATALQTMRDAAIMPLQLTKNRFYVFLEDVARIWADFWISYYGKRKIKISKNGIYEYTPFDADRYKNIIINTKIDINESVSFNEKEQFSALLTLFDKGIISAAELLERIPKGMIPNVDAINTNEVNADDRI